MKNTRLLFALAAVILLSAGMTTSCKNKASDNQQAEATADTLPMMEQDHDEYRAAIEAYLRTIGSQYTPGEVCIPSYTVVAINDSDTDYTRVWGDWWVFNYNIVGDTLVCVSGGSHPGMFRLEKDGEAYKVTAFDQVEDGSRNIPSAKRIFGDSYEDFHAINSNQEARDSVRLAMVAQYVVEPKLPVTQLQDPGWPAVPLPLQ